VERVGERRLTAVRLLCIDTMCLELRLASSLVELLDGSAVLTVVVDIAIVLFCRAARA
jgi:hypothetical protein